MKKKRTKLQQARALGYRSGLEVATAKYLDDNSVPYTYEELKIEWEDLMYRVYTPDYVLNNGIIIETKGRFTTADRRKHIEIKKQHPELDIRFVFSDAQNTLYKGSKTTYSNWCEQHGFQWAHRIVPLEWTQEAGTPIVTKRIKLKSAKKG